MRADFLVASRLLPTLPGQARSRSGGSGAGVFIDGDPEAGEIEQSQVIGAHGPGSFTVSVVG